MVQLLSAAETLDDVLLSEPAQDTTALEEALCRAAEAALAARDALFRKNVYPLRLAPAPEGLQ
jgi:hypothetical protein